MSLVCECAESNRWGSNHVGGDGPSPSRVMLIGEAPGAEEDQSGRPMVGGSGRVLGRWLYESGVFRGEVHVDNVFQHRPPGNNLQGSGASYGSAYESLRQRIARVNPRVIIACGETALNFFGRAGITAWRGSCFTWEDRRVVPMVHPAHIMRMVRAGGEEGVHRNLLWRFCVEDIKFAFRKAEHWPDPKRNYIINPTPKWFEEWERSIPSEAEVSLDLETDYWETRNQDNQVITMVSFSTEPYQAVVVDLEEYYLVPILRILKSRRRIVGQNVVLYDTIRLSELTGSAPARVYADIMLAHHLLQSPAPHDLGFINSCTTRDPYWKDEAQRFKHLYSAKDADVPLRIWQIFKAQLQVDGMWDLFQVVMKAAHYVRDMQMRGVPVDKQLITDEQRHLTAEADDVLRRIREVSGKKWFNPRSYPDCVDLLYKQLKLPEQYNVKFVNRQRVKKLTTDDDALVKLSRFSEIPKLILAYRRPANDVSKYFRPDTVIAGRWYFDWKMHGTESGRYSCGFHTIPPRARYVVRSPGKRIAAADAQQGEFRIAAWCADDVAAREVCETERGVHVENAVRIYSRLRGARVAPEEVSPMMKFYAKFTTFGWLYGRQAQSISEQYGVPYNSAQEIIDELNSIYKRIVIWKADTATFALRHGWLKNPYNRRRYFPEGSDADKEREAYAFIPQSTLHDIVQRAHIGLEESELGTHLEVVADHHDALISTVDETVSEDNIKVLLSREYLPGLVMPFDCTIGDWWIDKRAEEDSKGKVIVA